MKTAFSNTTSAFSASTFVSTAEPSTGLFSFVAVTSTVWFGVDDDRANSTGSVRST